MGIYDLPSAAVPAVQAIANKGVYTCIGDYTFGTTSGKISSYALLDQYFSDKWVDGAGNFTLENQNGEWQQGMGNNPNFGNGYTRELFTDYLALRVVVDTHFGADMPAFYADAMSLAPQWGWTASFNGNTLPGTSGPRNWDCGVRSQWATCRNLQKGGYFETCYRTTGRIGSWFAWWLVDGTGGPWPPEIDIDERPVSGPPNGWPNLNENHGGPRFIGAPWNSPIQKHWDGVGSPDFFTDGGGATWVALGAAAIDPALRFDPSADFHVYGMEWIPDGLDDSNDFFAFYIDQIKVWEGHIPWQNYTDTWHPAGAAAITFQAAYGGTWVGTNNGAAGNMAQTANLLGPAKSGKDQEWSIKYYRIFETGGTPPPPPTHNTESSGVFNAGTRLASTTLAGQLVRAWLPGVSAGPGTIRELVTIADKSIVLHGGASLLNDFTHGGYLSLPGSSDYAAVTTNFTPGAAAFSIVMVYRINALWQTLPTTPGWSGLWALQQTEDPNRAVWDFWIGDNGSTGSDSLMISSSTNAGNALVGAEAVLGDQGVVRCAVFTWAGPGSPVKMFATGESNPLTSGATAAMPAGVMDRLMLGSAGNTWPVDLFFIGWSNTAWSDANAQAVANDVAGQLLAKGFVGVQATASAGSTTRRIDTAKTATGVSSSCSAGTVSNATGSTTLVTPLGVVATTHAQSGAVTTGGGHGYSSGATLNATTLASQLARAWLPGVNNTGAVPELVSGTNKTATLHGTAAFGSDADGSYMSIPAATDYADVADSGFTASNDGFTVVAVMKLEDLTSPGDFAAICGFMKTDSSDWCFDLNHLPASFDPTALNFDISQFDGSFFSGFTGLCTVDVLVSIVATWDGTGSGYNLYVRGQSSPITGGHASSTPQFTGSCDHLRIGDPGLAWKHKLYFVAYSESVWSATDAQHVANDPAGALFSTGTTSASVSIGGVTSSCAAGGTTRTITTNPGITGVSSATAAGISIVQKVANPAPAGVSSTTAFGTMTIPVSILNKTLPSVFAAATAGRTNDGVRSPNGVFSTTAAGTIPRIPNQGLTPVSANAIAGTMLPAGSRLISGVPVTTSAGIVRGKDVPSNVGVVATALANAVSVSSDNRFPVGGGVVATMTAERIDYSRAKTMAGMVSDALAGLFDKKVTFTQPGVAATAIAKVFAPVIGVDVPVGAIGASASAVPGGVTGNLVAETFGVFGAQLTSAPGSVMGANLPGLLGVESVCTTLTLSVSLLALAGVEADAEIGTFGITFVISQRALVTGNDSPVYTITTTDSA